MSVALEQAVFRSLASYRLFPRNELFDGSSPDFEQLYADRLTAATGDPAAFIRLYSTRRASRVPSQEETEQQQRVALMRLDRVCRAANTTELEAHADASLQAAIQVCKLLDAITPRWRSAMLAGETLVVTNSGLVTGMASWLEGMADSEFDTLLRALSIKQSSDKENYTRCKMIAAMRRAESAASTEIPEKVRRPGRCATDMLDNLLRKTFGIKLADPKHSKKGERNIDASLFSV
jgi:hypothetical protein